MKKNSFGQGLAVFLVVIGIFYIIGAISEASEPKCIKSGCDNKQATNSSYCYLHKQHLYYDRTVRYLADSTKEKFIDEYEEKVRYRRYGELKNN